MSSIQLLRSQVQESEGTYTSIFPSELTTEEQSLIFVKKLIAVGISSITYLRMIFPESCYKNKWADGLNLKVLMDESSIPGANMLVSWIKGCFDAIEMKYLREMTLTIYANPQKPDNVLETYTFKFSYTENGEVQISEITGNGEDTSQKFEVKKPTCKMLRTIIMLTQSMESLPRTVHLSMKLHYYENVTPPDYEPPCFRSCPDEPYNFQEGSVNLKVGEINTPFHGIKLRAAVDTTQFSMGVTRTEREIDAELPGNKNEEIAASGSNCLSPVGSLLQSMDCTVMDRDTIIRKSRMRRLSVRSLPRSQSGEGDQESSTELTPFTSPENNFSRSTPSRLLKGALITTYGTPNVQTPKLTDILSNSSGSVCSTRSVSVDLAPTYDKDFPVRCPCGVNNDEGLMILCDVCGYWQHGACFTILEESQAPAKHYCEQCADPPSVCTDARLCWSDPTQIAASCLYRRALVIAAHLEGKVSSAIIAHRLGVNISLGTKVIEKLTTDKVLKLSKNGSRKVVDMDVLMKSAYPKYFNKTIGQDSQDKNATNSVGLASMSLLGTTDSQMTIDVLNNTLEQQQLSQNEAAGSKSAAVVSPGTERGGISEGNEKENKTPTQREKKPSKLRRGKRNLSAIEETNSPCEMILSSQDTSELFAPGRKRKKTSKSRSIRV